MPLHLLLWTTLCGPGIPIGADGTLGSTFAAQIQHVKSDMPSPVTIRKGLDIRLKGGVQGASHTMSHHVICWLFRQAGTHSTMASTGVSHHLRSASEIILVFGGGIAHTTRCDQSTTCADPNASG